MPALKKIVLAFAFGGLFSASTVLAQSIGSAAAASSPSSSQEPVPEASLSETQAIQDEAFLRYSRDRKAKRLSSESREAFLVQLQGHPLADYVLAWNLYDAISSDPADEIALEAGLDFIAKHHDEYIAERLGADLARMSASKGMTGLFERVYASLEWNKTEPDLAAWHAANQLRSGREGVQQALVLLAASQSLKTRYSVALAEALAAQSPEIAWSVSRLLIQGRNFPEARKILSAFTNADPVAINAIFSNAGEWLSSQTGMEPDRGLLVCAVLLVGYDNADFAAAVTEAHEASLSKSDLSLLWNFLGFRSALSSRNDLARHCFGKDGISVLPADFFQARTASEVRARAYLEVQDWAGLESAIRAMSKSKQAEDAWTYWLARSLKMTGKSAEATRLFDLLSSHHGYYGLLACDETSRAYPGERPVTPAPKESDVQKWAGNASIVRAMAFRRLHLYSMASREWNWALRNSSQSSLAAAAEYARRTELPERMINTASKLSPAFFFKLSFPTPLKENAAQIAGMSGVDEAWIYGVARQESRFMPAVASGAGAQGLMQILPSTAKWTASRYQLSDIPMNLSDPVANMTLGAYYLKYLSDRFDGQKLLATAGYNAGPGRSASWKKKLKEPQEGAIFAELIPFRETRDYVKHVLANTALYHQVLGTASSESRLTALLGTVTPSPSIDMPAASTE